MLTQPMNLLVDLPTQRADKELPPNTRAKHLEEDQWMWKNIMEYDIVLPPIDEFQPLFCSY